MLMKKEVIDENKRLKGQLEEKTYLYNKLSTESEYAIKELENQLEEEKKAYINMYNRYVEKDNIINKLEVFLKEGTELATGCGITKEYIYAYENVLDKLQELKGEDKNDSKEKS